MVQVHVTLVASSDIISDTVNFISLSTTCRCSSTSINLPCNLLQARVCKAPALPLGAAGLCAW
jgi:hypothetical protein